MGFSMIKVLIGIIVVAILIYIGIVAYQRYLLKQISSLVERKDQVRDFPVKNKINEVGSLKLSGSSLEGYTKLTNDYKAVTTKRLPEIDDIAAHARQDVNDMKIFEARRGVSAMKDSLDASEAESSRINDQLANIQKVDQDHRDAVKVLRLKYQDLRKTLLSQNVTLGPSIDILEDNLSKLDSDFDTFSETVDSGDHEKAQAQLQQLQSNTATLEQQIEDIPPLEDRLTNVFPGQLDEIQDAYEQLINHNYAFNDDNVRTELKAIKAKISENKETLGNLRLEAVQSNNESISKRIDVLYDKLQQEIDARKEVDNSFPIITDFIVHAEGQNKVLLSEVERLDQSYVFNSNEDETAQNLSSQLESIRSEHDRDTEQMTNQPVVYSDILARLKDENSQLNDIETTQAEVNQNLQALVDSEKDARRRLQQYDIEIHNIKRHVENINLPGIPNDYMDYFFVVSDEIEKASSSMNQVRINMEMINRELDMINTDLQTLTKKTTELTDNAALSELAIQYANRYRHTNEDVDAASRHAQRLFDSEHRYDQSLETISAALDKVEPGSVENITENYYQQKHTEY